MRLQSHYPKTLTATILACVFFTTVGLPALAQSENADHSAQTDDRANSVVENLEDLDISDKPEQALRAEQASAATLSNVPLNRLPLNISVIPRGILNLENATSTRAIIEQSGSVITGTGHSRTFERVFIRGFSADAELNGALKNGIPFYGVDSPVADPSALASVEVLKGSAGLLYGSAQPGGLINYVYKKPQKDAAYSISTTFGSFNTRRADVDATGSIAGSDKIAYRFTLGLEDSESWQDYVYNEKVAPTLQLRAELTDNTTLSLLAERIRIDNNPAPADTLLDAEANIIELPIETYLGHSNDFAEETTEQFQLQLDHRFSNAVALVAQVGSNTTKRDMGNTGYNSFTGPVDEEGNVGRLVFDQRRTSDGQYAAVHLTLDKTIGDFEHRALLGLNYSKNNMRNHNAFNIQLPEAYQVMATPITIYDPIPGTYPHRTDFEDSPPFAILDWTNTDKGFNVQDLVTYTPWNLHMLLGVRYGIFETQYNSDTVWSGEPRDRWVPSDNDAWIPRVGFVWDTTPSVSLYASYGESYRNQFGQARGQGGSFDGPGDLPAD